MFSRFVRSVLSPLTNRDEDYGYVKLTATSLKPFSGSPKDWPRFKMMSLNTFTAAGYDKLLVEEKYAHDNPRRNQIVFAQLATATMDGTARHLVNEFMSTQDGYSAWQAMINRFDGISMQHATAEQTRSLLNSTFLYTGNNCDAYIDKFLHLYGLLQAIPGESMSENSAIALFHRNNHDVDYKQTIETLQTQDLESLDDHVEKIRKKSITMDQERAHRRKMTKHVRRMNHNHGDYPDTDDDEYGTPEYHRQPPKRQRTRRSSSRARRLEGTIETKLSGLISIPSPEWKKLTPEDMSFVQKYNSKVKHREDPSSVVPPDGVKIVVGQQQQIRRTPSNMNYVPTESLQDVDTPPSAKRGDGKKISFHMHHGAKPRT